MEYQYTCQKKAEEKREEFIFIPEDTIVKKECLIDIDNETFVNCFLHMQKMGYKVYDDMIENFGEYGIKAETDKDEFFNLVSCFGDVLYQISLLGELNSHVLTVRTDLFKTGVKKYKYNLIINKLRHFGFEISNHNGKTFIKGAEYFEVSYPKNSKVIDVLKAYASVVKNYTDEIKPSMQFYTRDFYNFINFKYRFIEDETTREYPEPAFMIAIDRASVERQKVLRWLYDEAAKCGYKTHSGFGTNLQFNKGSKSFIWFDTNEEDGKTSVSTKISLKTVFENQPEKIRALNERFPKTFNLEFRGECCGGILPETATKGCFRFTFTYEGNLYLRCGLAGFVFENMTFDDMHDVLELYKIENKIKNE
jgi:hypothetical protein